MTLAARRAAGRPQARAAPRDRPFAPATGHLPPAPRFPPAPRQASCEPFLTADHRLMLEKGEEILVGIRILMRALHVERAIIGIENNKRDAIENFKKLASNDPGIQIAALKVKYPQGGEKQLVRALLKREVPKNGLPLDVGVVVVNVGTAAALARAFRDFDDDPLADVAILYGAQGTFCAGADLKAVASGEEANRLAPDGDGPMGPSRALLGKPVIAAIAGHAVAGGLELALWCDLRVASASAVFGVFCRRWGVPLIDGGTVRLPRLVGQGRAMDMLLTGRGVGADEALEMGLVNERVGSGEALARARRFHAAGPTATSWSWR